MPKLSNQDELVLALDLTEQELLENQAGRILSSQMKKIWKRQEDFWTFYLIVAFICGFGFIVSLLNLLSELKDSNLAPTIVFGLTSMLFTQFLWDDYYKLREDSKSGIVSSTQGLAMVDVGRGETLFLSINGIGFRAEQKTLLCIRRSEPYIVYYLPKSKVVVAVKVLEDT